MSKRVALVIDIEDSYGERELAARFCERLAAGTAELVVARSLERVFRDRFAVRGYDSPAEAIEILRQTAPEVVVGVEYFNLPESMQRALVDGPWTLATTDGTTIGVAINENPWSRPRRQREIVVPERLITLACCPIGDPAADSQHTRHWALWPGLTRRSRSDARAVVGSRAEHLVLMTISAWASRVAPPEVQRMHYDLMFDRLVSALRHVSAPVELVVVTSVKRPIARQDNVTVRFVDLLPPDAYETLLLGCDLFVTDSLIQMSAAKAFTVGIPTLALLNHDPAYGPTYDIFPLAVRVPPSLYRDALSPVQLADERAITERVTASLVGRDPVAPRAEAYRAALHALRTPAEIIAAL